MEVLLGILQASTDLGPDDFFFLAISVVAIYGLFLLLCLDNYTRNQLFQMPTIFSVQLVIAFPENSLIAFQTFQIILNPMFQVFYLVIGSFDSLDESVDISED
jgi:hypothetical protein